MLNGMTLSSKVARLRDDPNLTRDGWNQTALDELARVLAAPLSDVAEHFSMLVAGYLPHSALIILADDDVNPPKRQFGDADLTMHTTITELDALRDDAGLNTVWRDTVPIAGGLHPVLAAVADTHALLVLTNPGATKLDSLVLNLWRILALRLQQSAREASPLYLRESRAASSVRADAVTEVTDRHITTLESLLAVLRGATLDDPAARQAAISLAADALVHLRTEANRVRTFTDEPVRTAFQRLRSDLRPLVRYRDIDLQFVDPPVDGRALPSTIGHGARAVVRDAVLALIDQPSICRIRVKWDCDGRNLLIDIRDDGPGELVIDATQFDSLRQRVIALSGQLSLDATAGWGSQMGVIMPLDPPAVHRSNVSDWHLGQRELQVLEHLASGQRNRTIATQLGISENTVKFHISKIFRKLGVSSRSEAAALASQHLFPPALR